MYLLVLDGQIYCFESEILESYSRNDDTWCSLMSRKPLRGQALPLSNSIVYIYNSEHRESLLDHSSPVNATRPLLCSSFLEQRHLWRCEINMPGLLSHPYISHSQLPATISFHDSAFMGYVPQLLNFTVSAIVFSHTIEEIASFAQYCTIVDDQVRTDVNEVTNWSADVTDVIVYRLRNLNRF